ncbi:MAG: hypothetical protein WCO49_19505 [Nostocales cyanobacterium ELA608]
MFLPACRHAPGRRYGFVCRIEQEWRRAVRVSVSGVWVDKSNSIVRRKGRRKSRQCS